jgi:hypothetical protein
MESLGGLEVGQACPLLWKLLTNKKPAAHWKLSTNKKSDVHWKLLTYKKSDVHWRLSTNTVSNHRVRSWNVSTHSVAALPK